MSLSNSERELVLKEAIALRLYLKECHTSISNLAQDNASNQSRVEKLIHMLSKNKMSTIADVLGEPARDDMGSNFSFKAENTVEEPSPYSASKSSNPEQSLWSAPQKPKHQGLTFAHDSHDSLDPAALHQLAGQRWVGNENSAASSSRRGSTQDPATFSRERPVTEKRPFDRIRRESKSFTSFGSRRASMIAKSIEFPEFPVSNIDVDTQPTLESDAACMLTINVNEGTDIDCVLASGGEGMFGAVKPQAPLQIQNPTIRSQSQSGKQILRSSAMLETLSASESFLSDDLFTNEGSVKKLPPPEEIESIEETERKQDHALTIHAIAKIKAMAIKRRRSAKKEEVNRMSRSASKDLGGAYDSDKGENSTSARDIDQKITVQAVIPRVDSQKRMRPRSFTQGSTNGIRNHSPLKPLDLKLPVILAKSDEEAKSTEKVSCDEEEPLTICEETGAKKILGDRETETVTDSATPVLANLVTVTSSSEAVGEKVNARNFPFAPPPIPVEADGAVALNIDDQEFSRRSSRRFSVIPNVDLKRTSTQIQKSVVHTIRRTRTMSKAAVAVAKSSVSQPKYKLDGSLRSLNAETGEYPDESDNFGFFIKGFHPRSTFSVGWEFLMSLFYIAVFWLVPMLIAFDVQNTAYLCAIVFTAVYFVDMLVNIFTLRLESNENVASSFTLRDWHLTYLKREFAFDILSLFPYELLPVQSDVVNYLVLLRLLRLHHLPKIMKRSPIYYQIKRYLERKLGIGQTFSGIFALVFVLSAFLHFQACSLFFVGRIMNFSNPSIQFIQESDIFTQYTWALFQAVGNTFPLAYRPLTSIEQWVVVVYVILAAVLYATVIGTISSIALGMDASGRLYKQKMDELNDYMNWKNVSPSTRRKVIKYYQIKYRGKLFEEATLLGEMNESLRTEISVHNCRSLINKVPFLRREENDGRDELFLGRIASALQAVYYVNGDIIVNQGEIGSEMYFCLQGKVNIIVNGKPVTTFADGAFFGEVALIANIPRTATVQAINPCIMYRLTRASFMEILNEFDDMRRRIEKIYHERMIKVKQEEMARKEAEIARQALVQEQLLRAGVVDVEMVA